MILGILRFIPVFKDLGLGRNGTYLPRRRRRRRRRRRNREDKEERVYACRGEVTKRNWNTASSSSAILCGILDDMKLEQTALYSVAQTLYTRSLFLSSRAYRDPTVPITQYNGLCHVTLYHTYPLGVYHQASRTFSGDKKLGTPIAHQPTTVVEHPYHSLHK